MRATLVGLLFVSASFLLHAAPHPDPKSATPEGIWKSEGYGYVFQVDKTQVQAFEITSVSCIATWKSMRIEKGPEVSDDPGWVENPLQRHDSKEYNLGWWFGAGFAGGDEAFQILPTKNIPHPEVNQSLLSVPIEEIGRAVHIHRLNDGQP